MTADPAGTFGAVPIGAIPEGAGGALPTNGGSSPQGARAEVTAHRPNLHTTKTVGAGVTGRVLVSALIAFYVLLPLDFGFPTVPLFGRPLNSAIAATLVVFFTLAAESRGALLSFLREPYSVLQLACVCILVGSALRSASPPSALHASLLYCSTFVLNYGIFRYITRRHGVRWLSAVVVTIGIAAAAVGIAGSVFGLQVPMYDAWYRHYYAVESADYSLATERAAGTMNNAIIYGVLMVLVIPYALDLKHRYVRALSVFSVLFAASLSGSRTILVVAVFAVGAVAVYRWRTLWVLPFVSVAVVVLVASLGASAAAGDSRVAFLLERAGIKPESGTGVSPAALGISLRREVMAETFREMSQEWGGLTWMVGRGYFTAASVGMRLAWWYYAVDNVYLGVLYERGLIGLVFFVGAFLTFLIRTRRASTITLHWYSPLVVALAGFSFCWDLFSTFNILLVGSMAVAKWHEEQARRRSRRRRSVLRLGAESSNAGGQKTDASSCRSGSRAAGQPVTLPAAPALRFVYGVPGAGLGARTNVAGPVTT